MKGELLWMFSTSIEIFIIAYNFYNSLKRYFAHMFKNDDEIYSYFLLQSLIGFGILVYTRLRKHRSSSTSHGVSPSNWA